MISSIFHFRSPFFSSFPRSPNLIVRVKTGSSADPLHKRHPVTEQVHLWCTVCCVYVFERVMDGVTSVYDAWRVTFRVRKRVFRRYGVLQRKISLSRQRRASLPSKQGLILKENKLQILTHYYNRTQKRTY